MLVDKFREYGAVSDNEQAARQAISFCLENNFLKDFLETHKTEVFKMLLTEWKEEDALKIRWEEGREEGWGEGREEGVEEGMEKKARKIAEKMKNRGKSVDEIAEFTGLTVDDILRL